MLCTRTQCVGYTHVGKGTPHRLIRPDVRTSSCRGTAHLCGARHLALDEDGLEEVLVLRCEVGVETAAHVRALDAVCLIHQCHLRGGG